MKGSTRREESISPQLLDLFQTRDKNDNNVKRQSHVDTSSSSSSSSSDERVLELRLGLGPPVLANQWPPKNDSLLSLGYCSSSSTTTKTTSSFLVSENNNNNNNNNINIKKKASSSVTVNPAVTNNTSQKRTAPAPVVGWPPIRSFRKNLASSSKQPANDNNNDNNAAINNNNNEINSNIIIKNGSDKSVEEINSNNIKKGMFVKINMEGVPIGRKVDLKAFDTYDKLSSAVDQLFRGLLAAQRDSNGNNNNNHGEEEEKIISGLMDGSGEYTLVYEDNEGDRMLVGDVPWNMFVSTVKRLRVLKSSELSLVRGKQGQMK